MIRTLSRYYSDFVEGANSIYNGSNLQDWLDAEVRWKDGVAHPTASEVQAKSEELEEIITASKAEYDSKQYQRDRTYPPLGEQLDMIYHAGLGGDEFQAAIKAVKDEFPKP
jgi:hypothetical protein